MDIRQQIVDEARTWLNTPFHHQGRVKSVGVDCAGVVIGVAKALGLSDFDTVDYAKQPNANAMTKVLNEHMVRIPVNEATIGDVLHFAFDREPQHVGFITDIGILHAYAQVRKCIEHSFDDAWKARVRGAYRFKGID
jgi:NlpC/P60 family putative phage cell wall peptidase